MKFLLDSNFLLIPVQFRVDIFSGLEEFGKPELFTLDLVVRELEGLGRKGRLSLELARGKGVAVLKSRGKVTDEELLRTAMHGFTVCTQDRALARKLHEARIPVITLRQGKRLILKEEF